MNRDDTSFQHILTRTERFVITCEHIPGRMSRDPKIDEILAFAEQGRSTGLVHAISLTDNPGGLPAMSPDALAREIEATGMSAIVHVTAKDMNRSLIESRLLALDRMGVPNILVMSGDFPTDAPAGLAMPVFDVDPVHILTMITLMNKGWRINGTTRALDEGSRTALFHGGVVNPCKCTESEVMTQLYKMEKKYRAGARYFITQLGFDAVKLRDFMTWCREAGIDVPILGSVFILRQGAAKAMHRGAVPGSLVTDRFLDTIAAEAKAPDKGRAASLERAAMQVAVLRGLGFRGAHIEAMVLKFDMVETILGRAAELANSWEECAEKLDYSPDASFSLANPGAYGPSMVQKKLRSGWGTYRAMRLLHGLFFTKGGGLGGLMKAFSRMLDRVKPLDAVVHAGETGVKRLLFDCRDCGDCALPELQYLCPQSQCPKQERNAPCGGSRLDACEVYPDRPCVWARVYVRAKASDELGDLRRTIIGPRDWRLRDTSSWVNFHLDRDHAGYDFTAFFDAPERLEKESGEAK